MLFTSAMLLNYTNNIKHQALSTNIATIFLILKVIGKRVVNKIHTKLNLNCLLNHYLFRRNIVATPILFLSRKQDDAYHFL